MQWFPSFPSLGISLNGGKLEVAQQMVHQESARTSGLYDRRNDQGGLDEAERILSKALYGPGTFKIGE